MAEQKPLSPFTLTPARIMILVLGILALIFIIGSITGGLTNYQLLKNSTISSSSEGPA